MLVEVYRRRAEHEYSEIPGLSRSTVDQHVGCWGQEVVARNQPQSRIASGLHRLTQSLFQPGAIASADSRSRTVLLLRGGPGRYGSLTIHSEASLPITRYRCARCQAREAGMRECLG